MVGLPLSLTSAISNASAPELKDILRKINSTSPVGKETITRFMNSLDLDERNDSSALRDVVWKTCQELVEVRGILIETLADHEEEPPLGKQLLERSPDDGYESTRSSSLERQGSKKRKFKWKMNTVPRSEPKRTKSSETLTTNEISRPLAIHKSNLQLERGIKYGNKPNGKFEVEPGNSTTRMVPKKKTIDDIFAADAARRVKEEQEEKAQFKKSKNLGPWIRTSELPSVLDARSTMKTARIHMHHVPFILEQSDVIILKQKLARARQATAKEASRVIYGSCANCREDVEIDEDDEDRDYDDHDGDDEDHHDGSSGREKRMLCDPCREEEEKVTASCKGCDTDIRVHPDDWTADEEIWCEECEYFLEQRSLEEDRWGGMWCEKCKENYKVPEDKKDFDPDAELCLDCQYEARA
ncbi:uncharacterized protein PAC_01535 [Phialocephala subalpina]|uniref:Uncharacterized protein n=1 Tax=Phialocephala subalpina TaxID=576137 RepID=A0A1L7WFX0_9HELO|nr:uncharacterized protein PAC_01535 [Phialocephala subalpina]